MGIISKILRKSIKVKCKKETTIPFNDINGKKFESNKIYTFRRNKNTLFVDGQDPYSIQYKNDEQFIKYFEVI